MSARPVVLNKQAMRSSAPSLTDDEHMDPARLSRVVQWLRMWSATCEGNPATLMAVPRTIGIAMATIAAAELEMRLRTVALLNARTSAARTRARDDMEHAATRLRIAVDRLLDVEAFRDGAAAPRVLSPTDQ